MAKWQIYGKVHGTKYIGEVEADTEEQAKTAGLAHPNCYVAVCCHCSGQVEDPEIEDVIAEVE